LKRRDLERHLRAHGAENLREGARHSVWAIGGPESDRIAAVPRHIEIKTGTVRAICNALGIPNPSRR
jgi:HicA toxin of bacterial toxin-antitoxin,